MQVELTPTLDRMVHEKVASGLYENASEVVRKALRMMVRRESSLDKFRREAARGFEQLEAEEWVDLSREEFFQQMHQNQCFEPPTVR